MLTPHMLLKNMLEPAKTSLLLLNSTLKWLMPLLHMENATKEKLPSALTPGNLVDSEMNKNQRWLNATLKPDVFQTTKPLLQHKEML